MSQRDDIHPEPSSPFLVERLMREARRGRQDIDFSSEEEFRDRLPGFIDEGLPARRLESLREDPEELAQEFAFEAYEADEEDTALDLVDKALLLDPDCVDALTIRAFLTSEDAGQLVAALEHAAGRGEKRLGEDFFAEFMGDFWPLVEARPYLRTLKHLAEVLWTIGRRLDAVTQYEDLIDLDPADHMGNSTLLLGYYLSLGEVQRAWDLLEEYDDGKKAVFNWGWVLLLLMTGDEEAARQALDHALKSNIHVAPLLVGMIPDTEVEPPAFVRPGSQEEALLCADILGEAWDRARPAQFWLSRVLIEMGLLAESDLVEGTPPPAP